MQATFCGVQVSSASAGTLSTIDITITSTVLMLRLDAETKSTEKTAYIYLDFYLPDTPESKLSQIKWQTSTWLLADRNPVAVITMKIWPYTIQWMPMQNGKIYANFLLPCF